MKHFLPVWCQSRVCCTPIESLHEHPFLCALNHPPHGEALSFTHSAVAFCLVQTTSRQASTQKRSQTTVFAMNLKSQLMSRNNWQSIASSRSIATRACLREHGTTKAELRQLATRSDFQGRLYLEIAEDRFEPMLDDDGSYVCPHRSSHLRHAIASLSSYEAAIIPLIDASIQTNLRFDPQNEIWRTSSMYVLRYQNRLARASNVTFRD